MKKSLDPKEKQPSQREMAKFPRAIQEETATAEVHSILTGTVEGEEAVATGTAFQAALQGSSEPEAPEPFASRILLLS